MTNIPQIKALPNEPDTACDFNLRILQSPARWIEDLHGKKELERIATLADLAPEDLDGKSRWTSLERIEAFLADLYDLASNDETFIEACSYRLKDGYGPFRFLFQALSPQFVYDRAVSTFRMITNIGHLEVVESRRNYHCGRYFSEKPESRLMCLSRQAQMSTMPTIWGLPPARLTETSCIARGDEYCEYHLRWYEHGRWLPTLAGILVGLAASFALGALGLGLMPAWTVLPILGGALGHIFELRRTNRANLKIGEESNKALTQLAGDDADARRELLASRQREKNWNRLMEEQTAERDAELEKTVTRLQKIMKERDAALLGISHDLKNPLGHLLLQAGYLEMAIPEGADEDTREALRDHLESIRKMDLLIVEMVDMVKSGSGIVEVKPEIIQTSQLVDQLRRRLAAYARGTNISTNVFSTREAPSVIAMDRVVLDRVADNLLTNAIKYTDKGNVLVELDGKPGFLTIKVSDTGRGIEEEEKKRIFLPQGSDVLKRAEGSHGVGLSGVARLMNLIGGEIEVMSLPGKGTTFWAHFPEKMQILDEKNRRPSVAPEPADIVGKVVTFRKSMTP